MYSALHGWTVPETNRLLYVAGNLFLHATKGILSNHDANALTNELMADCLRRGQLIAFHQRPELIKRITTQQAAAFKSHLLTSLRLRRNGIILEIPSLQVVAKQSATMEKALRDKAAFSSQLSVLESHSPVKIEIQRERVEPKVVKPKLLIVGTQPTLEKLVAEKFGAVADLRYISSDNTCVTLRTLPKNMNHVFVMKAFAAHSVWTPIKDTYGSRAHLVLGGNTSMLESIQAFV